MAAIHYEYRLGFRYAANDSSVEREYVRPQRKQSSILLRQLRQRNDDFCMANGEQASATPSPRTKSWTGRELAAIQIQRIVRGWRARVWAAKEVYYHAWRALTLIQARCRGVLARDKLRRDAANLFSRKEIPTCRRIVVKNRASQRSRNRRQAPASPAGVGEERERRCSERTAWERSWARASLKRPNFRDRVRVWQAIVDLKRAGGSGRMEVTNSEAWAALCESSGSTSVARTFLSNEDARLGRRLRGEVDEVPPYLRLDRAAVADVTRTSIRVGDLREAPIRLKKVDNRQGRKAKEAGRGRNDIFNALETVFYKV